MLVMSRAVDFINGHQFQQQEEVKFSQDEIPGLPNNLRGRTRWEMGATAILKYTVTAATSDSGC